MTRQLAMLFASVALLGGFTTVFAGRASETMPPHTPKAAQGKQEAHGAMMGNMSPEQMQKMMESCKRMMEGVAKTPAEPTK